MKPVMKNTKTRSQQQGAALVVGLIMLLLLTLIGVAGMRDTLLQQKMVANTKDREVALQAAEAALQRAESDLRIAVSKLPMTGVGRYDLNIASQKAVLDSQRAASSSEAAFWKGRAWNSSDSIAYNLALNGVAAGNEPRYVIEELPLESAATRLAEFTPGEAGVVGGGGSGGKKVVDESLGGCSPCDPSSGTSIDYRITARGVGSTTNAVVILQSTMRRFELAPP